jgi:uncharacterized protein involved in exopolysaccharide biosynthesis
MYSLPGNAPMVHNGNGGVMRQIVEAAFRHRRLWFFTACIVFSASIAYILLRPRQYLSEMDILVQNTRGADQITPSRVTGTITINGVTEEQINSEIQLLQSRNLASVVIDPQWDQRPAGSLTTAEYRAHDKAIDKFEKHLSVELVRKSNVIHVAYAASDPGTANETLNRLLTAFLAKQREIAQPPGTAKFFAEEAARYKTELDQAQKELADYQQQHQLVSLEDTERVKTSEIDDAESELRSTDAEISELTQRIGTQEQQLKTIPARQATQQRVIPNDYSIERLNTMLAELENERTSLLTKFTPSDRLVEENGDKIANTRKALADAQQMTSNENASDVNPVWQAVTGSIIQSESEREAMRAREDALKRQIAGLRSNLDGIEGSTVAFNTLHQKVTDLENDYQLYTQKRDEAEIADAMNENRLLNVAVQQTPTYSVIPFHPKPVTDMILGGFTAIFLACFTVFFAEVGRDTFANAGELEAVSMFPVFATVPLDLTHGKDRADAMGNSELVFAGMAANRQFSGDRQLPRATGKIQQERNAL